MGDAPSSTSGRWTPPWAPDERRRWPSPRWGHGSDEGRWPSAKRRPHEGRPPSGPAGFQRSAAGPTLDAGASVRPRGSPGCPSAGREPEAIAEEWLNAILRSGRPAPGEGGRRRPRQLTFLSQALPEGVEVRLLPRRGAPPRARPRYGELAVPPHPPARHKLRDNDDGVEQVIRSLRHPPASTRARPPHRARSSARTEHGCGTPQSLLRAPSGRGRRGRLQDPRAMKRGMRWGHGRSHHPAQPAAVGRVRRDLGPAHRPGRPRRDARKRLEGVTEGWSVELHLRLAALRRCRDAASAPPCGRRASSSAVRIACRTCRSLSMRSFVTAGPAHARGLGLGLDTHGVDLFLRRNEPAPAASPRRQSRPAWRPGLAHARRAARSAPGSAGSAGVQAAGRPARGWRGRSWGPSDHGATRRRSVATPTARLRSLYAGNLQSRSSEATWPRPASRCARPAGPQGARRGETLVEHHEAVPSWVRI